MYRVSSVSQKFAFVIAMLLVGASIQQAPTTNTGGTNTGSNTGGYRYPDYSSRATLRKSYDANSNVTIGFRIADRTKLVMRGEVIAPRTSQALCLYVALGTAQNPGPSSWVGSDILLINIRSGFRVETSNLVDAVGVQPQTNVPSFAHITSYLYGTSQNENQNWQLYRSDSSTVSNPGTVPYQTYSFEVTRGVERFKNDGANDVDFNKNGMNVQFHVFEAPNGMCYGYGAGGPVTASDWNSVPYGNVVADFSAIASAMTAISAIFISLILN